MAMAPCDNPAETCANHSLITSYSPPWKIMAHRLEGRDPGRCGWGALTGRGLVSRADQTWIRPFALPVGATFVGDTSLPHLQGRTSLSRSDPVPGLVRSRQTVARLSQARDLPKRVMQIRINRPRRPRRRRCHRHADPRSVLGCWTSLIDLSPGFGRGFFFGPLGSRLVQPERCTVTTL